jgi:hypothetical protein
LGTAQLTLFEDTLSPQLQAHSERSNSTTPTRLREQSDGPLATAGRQLWSVLLRKTFAVDVTVCVVCGGRMRLLEFATTPKAVARALWRAGLGPQPPPAAPRMHNSAQLTLALS